MENYHTNQICKFCARFRDGHCQGKDGELFKPCVNHYCPYFLDRNHVDILQRDNYNFDLFNKATQEPKLKKFSDVFFKGKK